MKHLLSIGDLSAADIQTLADVHGFDNINTDPSISPVPEPAAGLLVLSAGLLVLARRRRA
ncbi:MAG: PEP-CTERM sorting domain-containing protein [Ilumatobacteraceae bacterium]|nr:PEP-CTERM sorting domain-containing protein [Ilumatobacteraceae bacterium]